MEEEMRALIVVWKRQFSFYCWDFLTTAQVEAAESGDQYSYSWQIVIPGRGKTKVEKK